jgi:FkbM family methyltransferase
MVNNLRRAVYKMLTIVLRTYWFLRGGRRLKACGFKYKFLPRTGLPLTEVFLPRRNALDGIVKYADHVQMRSLLLYATKLASESIIVDIGAYHGVYAILLGKIVQQNGGKVIAVEPNQDSYKVLQRNVELNLLEDTVICENVAILDREGELSLRSDDSCSYVKVASRDVDNIVSATTLEKLTKKHGITNIDVLIIDIEGAELLALRGFPWETVGVDKIFCELHPYNWKVFGYSGTDFQKFIEEKAFICFDMYFEHRDVFSEERYIGPTLLLKKADLC